MGSNLWWIFIVLLVGMRVSDHNMELRQVCDDLGLSSKVCKFHFTACFVA